MRTVDRAFAAVYDRLGPAAERTELGRRRAELLEGVSGHVVDVGAGVGANLPHLRGDVTRATLLEPAPAMAARLREVVARDGAARPVEVIEAPGEAMPLPDGSVDVVVFTLVLCTVQDVALTLREARRVLRPGGAVALLEHVRGTGALGRLQDTIRPAWGLLAGGCDPSRRTRASLEAAGFDTAELAEIRLGVLGPASPALVGSVRPR